MIMAMALIEIESREELDGSMAAAVEAGIAVMDRLRSGELTQEEADRMVDEIVAGVE